MTAYQGLLIYDNGGNVLSVIGGYSTVPAGIQGIIADIPTNMKSVRIDLTTHQPIFELTPDTEGEVTNLQDAIIELEARVNALEGN